MGGSGEAELDDHNPPTKRLCLEFCSAKVRTGQEADNPSTAMDNSSEVVTKIAGLYAERLMSDVTVVVGKLDTADWSGHQAALGSAGKQELPAHRLILCASSEVFQIMLMSNNWTEASEKRIVLKESPACQAVFEVFLKYLYTGKISVDYANVIPILQVNLPMHCTVGARNTI